MLSLSIAFPLIGFLLDRVAVVTVITPVGRNIKTNLAATTPMRRNSIMVNGNGGRGPFLNRATKSADEDIGMNVGPARQTRHLAHD
jgi:hypothetical protein